MTRVLILGGYGNFGRFISRQLAESGNLTIIVAGRSLSKARRLADEVNGEALEIDIHNGFENALAEAKPEIVIHTCGPFQSQNYDVALSCIRQGVHYIDLADARKFVAGITRLDQQARAANVMVVSGASSVPCLTSALAKHYNADFAKLEAIDYGITTAQRSTPGAATVSAILGYIGKPFVTLVDGKKTFVYGWQGLRGRRYSKLGLRLFSYCNVPDLELFPKSYPELKTQRFYAGLELPYIHISLWLISWFVRIGIIKKLSRFTPELLRLSSWFDRFGSSNSGFHMVLSGLGKGGERKNVTFELTALNGDGLYIPCVPAVLMVKKIVGKKLHTIGARPCVDMISKEEYLEALSKFDITWAETFSERMAIQ